MAKVTGGDKFKKKILELASKLSDPPSLRVGFLENATYPAGTKKQIRARYAKKKTPGALKGAAGNISVPMVAAIMEFGAPSRGIPPRPFFRSMIAAHKDEWPNAIAKTLKSTNYNVDKTLRLVGQAIQGQLQKSIRDLTSPALKPATIARKGFSKPLVDTGHLLSSVDYEVE